MKSASAFNGKKKKKKESDAIWIPRLCKYASPVTRSPYLSGFTCRKRTITPSQVPHIAEWGGEGTELTMCNSWRHPHDSDRCWHTIARKSCVFVIVAQRGLLAALNYCFLFPRPPLHLRWEWRNKNVAWNSWIPGRNGFYTAPLWRHLEPQGGSIGSTASRKAS